jgi:cysteine desulfuration protein SufE
MTYSDKQMSIIEDFELFEDWLQKYEFIIELGKEVELIPEEQKTNDLLIDGCQSRVWLKSEYKENKMYYYADSDAIITKGIISLLIKVMNAEAPSVIAKDHLFFIEKIGLQEHLSPTRANGLLEMVKRMKLDAIKHA